MTVTLGYFTTLLNIGELWSLLVHALSAFCFPEIGVLAVQETCDFKNNFVNLLLKRWPRTTLAYAYIYIQAGEIYWFQRVCLSVCLLISVSDCLFVFESPPSQKILFIIILLFFLNLFSFKLCEVSERSVLIFILLISEIRGGGALKGKYKNFMLRINLSINLTFDLWLMFGYNFIFFDITYLLCPSGY